MAAIRIAVVGLGKIARDRHIPALRANAAFELVAVADPHCALDGVAHFPSLDALLDTTPDVEAVAICTPPQLRAQLAQKALAHGCHVLLEKPPATTPDDGRALVQLAREKHVTLFATWHSRFAAGVEPAREWLQSRRMRAIRVNWKEDVRVWHPGQGWIWKTGGFGVFDPGINALSILTRLSPGTIKLHEAQLAIPVNCETPIAARLSLRTQQTSDVVVELDFQHPGIPQWTIAIDTDRGPLRLAEGGAVLDVDGERIAGTGDMEYASVYGQFAGLIAGRLVDVDLAPLELVTDALNHGRREMVAPFIE